VEAALEEARTERERSKGEWAGREEAIREEMQRLEDALADALRKQGRLEETAREQQERVEALQSALRRLQRSEPATEPAVVAAPNDDPPRDQDGRSRRPQVPASGPRKATLRELRERAKRYLRDEGADI
jgi:hypothetical protein